MDSVTSITVGPMYTLVTAPCLKKVRTRDIREPILIINFCRNITLTEVLKRTLTEASGTDIQTERHRIDALRFLLRTLLR